MQNLRETMVKTLSESEWRGNASLPSDLLVDLYENYIEELNVKNVFNNMGLKYPPEKRMYTVVSNGFLRQEIKTLLLTDGVGTFIMPFVQLIYSETPFKCNGKGPSRYFKDHSKNSFSIECDSDDIELYIYSLR